jgi:GTP pyrophosphokinase
MISFYPFKSLIPFFKSEDLSLDPILEELKKHHPDTNVEIIKKAYDFASKAHKNQKRKSGEPFLVHPLKVAFTLAKLGLGEQTVAAGLVHDTIEDSSLTLKNLRSQTSSTVAYLVEGVTKLKKLQDVEIPKKQEEIFYENLRRMFIAMAKDLRVVIIKLVDRLHNMETLKYMPKEKRYRIAKQTLEIYAPLANRLGIGEIRGQLEDYAFMYVYPSEYEWLIRNFQKKYNEQKNTPNIFKINSEEL